MIRMCARCGAPLNGTSGNFCLRMCVRGEKIMKDNKDRGLVQHPNHYNAGKFEVIDVIEDWDLGFNLGNAVKYVARAEHKGTELQDLKKAAWYLLRRIREQYPDKEGDMEDLMEKLK